MAAVVPGNTGGVISRVFSYIPTRPFFKIDLLSKQFLFIHTGVADETNRSFAVGKYLRRFLQTKMLWQSLPKETGGAAARPDPGLNPI
ncbi:hypothetical protein [Herbaspirillum sp. CF444]|uniref:hypothetical protein n=1 Tax=Herbaspirillum sp. CF444 TaxID=1144319 RepID=UPI001ED8CE1B|nr:hypothetical protein [Herbaspirillum sp. CF444]